MCTASILASLRSSLVCCVNRTYKWSPQDTRTVTRRLVVILQPWCSTVHYTTVHEQLPTRSGAHISMASSGRRCAFICPSCARAKPPHLLPQRPVYLHNWCLPHHDGHSRLPLPPLRRGLPRLLVLAAAEGDVLHLPSQRSSAAAAPCGRGWPGRGVGARSGSRGVACRDQLRSHAGGACGSSALLTVCFQLCTMYTKL